MPVKINERFESASLDGPAQPIFPMGVARPNAASREGILLENISFPGAIRAESDPRNLGIPGMGKPGQGIQARDRVGPSHGIP